MRDLETFARSALAVAAVAVAMALLLPLVGAAVFLLRFVLVGGAVVLLLGGLGAALVPRLRRSVVAAVERQVDYKGLRLATDVGMAQGHAWARVEEDGAFVGADDVVQACLGPLDSVELPIRGRRVRRGDTLFALARGDRRLDIASPLDGEVLHANQELQSDPERVNRDPFGLGWVARLRVDDTRRSRRALLRGSAAREWSQSEVDRLLAMIGGTPASIPTLPDGGVVIDDVHRLIDEPTWNRIRDTLFGAEPQAGQEEEP
jgi:glycine cleavage system H protein